MLGHGVAAFRQLELMLHAGLGQEGLGGGEVLLGRRLGLLEMGDRVLPAALGEAGPGSQNPRRATRACMSLLIRAR